MHVLVVHAHLAREPVCRHAVDAAAEHGVLNSGVGRDHHGFDVAHARVVGQLLNDFVGRSAGGAKHDAHAADGLHLAGGELVVAAVEHDDGLVFAAGEVDDVVNQTLACRVERIIGIVGMRERLLVTRPRAQHVVAVHQQDLLTLLCHHASLLSYDTKIIAAGPLKPARAIERLVSWSRAGAVAARRCGCSGAATRT